ncbi:uncharacterized protein LOC143537376 [Bidens hawaiensis]|uniref:uncharacterized protein LOC143537376 n=1 Tax=Bidens hawaiensis TaxID=980011 RepID=UPI004049869F
MYVYSFCLSHIHVMTYALHCLIFQKVKLMIFIPGQDHNGTGTHPRVGHVSHSVVLGTFGIGEQDEGGTPDVNQVIGAVLNFFGQGLIAGGGAAQPHMQYSRASCTWK